MADVHLSQRDIDYISRVVATEVPASLARTNPEEYSRMVGAVVDTITNRVASEGYPDTVTGVVNQLNQFSAINGPVPGAYGRVQNAPKASPELQSLVASHIADISQGVEESEIAGSTNYANPNFSSANNLRDWVNPMIEAGALKLGIGDMVHYHGIIPGDEAVGPYSLTAEGIPSNPNVAVPVDNPMKGLLSVVDPYDPNANLRTGSLLAPVSTTWQDMAQANLAAEEPSGFLGPNVDVLSVTRQDIQPAQDVAAAEDQANEWGVINGVGPVYTPAVNSWAPVAAANPVTAPMGSVVAQGFLGANPALSAGTTVRGLPETVTAPSQEANADLSFDNSRFDGFGLSVAPIDASRFASSAKTSRIGEDPAFADARMPGLIDPTTNTTSFLDQPATPADIGGFLEASAAQRGALLGVDSAEAQTIRGLAEIAHQKALTDPALNAFPSASITAPVDVASLDAQGTTTTTDVAANPQEAAALQAVAAHPGLLSPAQLSSTSAPLSFTKSLAVLNQPVANPGYLNAPVAAAQPQVTSVPDLETVTVKDQPAVTDAQVNIPGPATTPAEDQQQITAPTKTARTVPAETVAQPSFSDRVAKALNPGTAIGAAIGAGFLGIPGAVAGGFLGNQVNGFLNKPSQPMAINNIGSGSEAVYSIWGGGTPPGTQATASDGQQVTSMPGGNVAITNAHGVTTVFDKTGKAMSYFGDSLGQDQDQDTASTNSGGFFGGLFG